jgi:NAD(P)-dependent dehydrogenase (short-subunit alcohol dehydrogenase family)
LVKELVERLGVSNITRVCICNGILHGENIWPEKRLEDINTETMLEVFTTNCIVPILWLRGLLDIVKGTKDCVIAVFSARIGSIGDNHSGGWYSYRASKSALNMLLKSTAIEYGRRASNVKLIAFHPGTTDTNLSKPFQSRIKPENLFSPEFVAMQLVDIMNDVDVDGELSYLDWNNKAIAW